MKQSRMHAAKYSMKHGPLRWLGEGSASNGIVIPCPKFFAQHAVRMLHQVCFVQSTLGPLRVRGSRPQRGLLFNSPADALGRWRQ